MYLLSIYLQGINWYNDWEIHDSPAQLLQNTIKFMGVMPMHN